MLKTTRLVMSVMLAVSATLAAAVLSARAQDKPAPAAATAAVSTEEAPLVFPHHWVRGFVDFGVAPSHNEPDLGRCAFPQPPGSGGVNSPCTAYARYLLGGYLEVQPLGRTFAKRVFVFFDPTFSFGNNIPQVKYTASMEPIAFEHGWGAGIKLPKSFEVRATWHNVDYLGRYAQNLGPADLRTFGPYGLYFTAGARWYFGGYGDSGEAH